MIRRLMLPWLLLCSTVILAQQNTGVIEGTVNTLNGNIAEATVEATHLPAGTLFTTKTGSEGFRFAGLPAGTYEIVVPPLGWATDRFEQTDVELVPGQTLHLDIQLVQNNLGTIGDDLAYVAIMNKYAGIEGETPRTADGKPDLSGVWQGNRDPEEASTELLPWAAKLLDERIANEFRDSPSASCLPEPTPIGPTIYRFIQTDEIIVELFELQPGSRQIYTDGRGHPDDLDPAWQGHSIGFWEGDTLVVDTVGFNDQSWLWNGSPHTEQLHVIERYTRPDLGHLNVDVIMEDPGALLRPWELHMVWNLVPGEEVLEMICNENNLYHENISPE